VFLDANPGSLTEPLGDRRWDRTEVARRFRASAEYLDEVGLRPGDRVFVHFGNSLEFFVDLIALWWLGGVAVPIDARLTDFEVLTLAEAATPRFSLWREAPDEPLAAKLLGHGVDALVSASSQGGTRSAGPARFRLDDPALILFTSGTTGNPKGVVHTHRSLRARWTALRDSVGLDSFRRTLCLLPTHFGHGLICNALYPWLSGADLIVLPPFQPEVVVHLGALLDEEQVTFMSSVPPVWRLAMKTGREPREGTLERVFCGSASLSRSLWSDIRAWTGTPDVFNVYGITETASWVAGTNVGAFEPEDGLVGLPWGAVVKIVRDGSEWPVGGTLDDECEPGEPGHVWLNTPALMQGYLDRDDLTADAVVGGWFRTGDVGVVDERGWLSLLGRERDEINKGGMKIYPGDIEAVVDDVPGVADACVFAIDDPLYEQDVGIALVLDGDRVRVVDDLQRLMTERLAKHQRPVRWYLLDEIPRSSRGKVNRKVVADACATLTALRPAELKRTVGDDTP
jgi:acyl-CoA synthetase (AMP-forming)/AMP-acid ligase II